ncbi:FAD-dependent oxidoreductase [Desulfotalea psychrophila]|uniref:Related to NADH oxidase n=1 Tax=Desulfotalea psychrophila (strain LSv54 / DSM 12343) TaxID=177439 RepID=Q6AJ61_DESPS|nr:FAD-dependent oxidoreductase [Desulfotalea psychrophila]CAG37619.1 related to NADH oxidase [Desulfotalea psychrophila LSv54]
MLLLAGAFRAWAMMLVSIGIIIKILLEKRMGERIVIIGGVAAGPKAACRIKRLSPRAEVVVIDQDALISYGGCGIPYYVSGDVADEKELRSTSFHMLRDEFFFDKAKRVTAMTSTRAISIDRAEKTVLLQDVKTGAEETVSYDKLLLATGSQPFILPIPGVDLDGVFTVTDMHKAIEIKARIAKGQVGKAVVIGGGAIGIEMAEALKDLWGVETSLVEFQKQLLPNILDWPMAAMLAQHMDDKDVHLYLGESAAEIVAGDADHVAGVRLSSGKTLDCDMVIMATGVRPRSELAKEAGLHVSSKGGIVVNERMQTSDPTIYAAGDCVEIPHLVSGRSFYAPLGSLANKEGRVAADNIVGIPTIFKGAIGSFILKAFDFSAASTGLSLESALAEGFDADVSLTSSSDRAHFFPTQQVLCLQLVFDRRTRRVLGLQGIGGASDALLARIDAAAVAITAGATVDDFGNIEMAYAPPFSTAIDAINAAGYVAENLIDGRMRQMRLELFYAWMENVTSQPDWLVLDVRHPKQAKPFMEKYGDLWLNLPYEQVRDRYAELPTDKTLVIFCNAGSRSFEIQRLLDSVGLENNIVLAGGYNFIKRMGADWLPV